MRAPSITGLLQPTSPDGGAFVQCMSSMSEAPPANGYGQAKVRPRSKLIENMFVVPAHSFVIPCSCMYFWTSDADMPTRRPEAILTAFDMLTRFELVVMWSTRFVSGLC